MTLREYIKSGGITTAAIASELGVSISAVRKWIYGHRTPDLQTALAIVKMTDGKVDLESLAQRAA